MLLIWLKQITVVYKFFQEAAFINFRNCSLLIMLYVPLTFLWQDIGECVIKLKSYSINQRQVEAMMENFLIYGEQGKQWLSYRLKVQHKGGGSEWKRVKLLVILFVGIQSMLNKRLVQLLILFQQTFLHLRYSISRPYEKFISKFKSRRRN